MPNYVIDGWIRAQLTYLTTENVGIEQFSYYSTNFNQFGETEELKKARIKFFDFKDESTKTTFSASFAYDELGIKFSVSTNGINDKTKAFQVLIERGVNGYKSFKEHFLNKICPSNIKVQFRWEGLLLSIYNFTSYNDSLVQQKTDLSSFIDLLKKYTDTPRKAVFAKGLIDPIPPYSNDKIEIRTMADVIKEEDQKRDFDLITLANGEENMFYIKHHLFATSFFIDDLSSSLNTVAEWGFKSGLVLTDFHFEKEELNDEIERLKKSVKKDKEKLFILGSDSLQADFTNLEKKSRFLNEERTEFVNISDHIYSAIKENQKADKIFDTLGKMKSLPHSLDFSYEILQLRQLDFFKDYESTIEDIKSDLSILDIKFRRSELYVILIVAISLAVSVSLGYYINQKLTDGLLDPIANIVQILTFVVAIMLLLLRQRKR